MQRININSQQLEVRQITGSETLAPIVFMHEGLGSVSLWTQRGLDWPLAVCEATGRAGVVYSRRGYGQSDAAPGRRNTSSPGRNVLSPDYMHREALDVLPALLAELQIPKPILLGHSDGATIALLHASQFPVSACIAMAPHVLVESIAVKAIGEAKQAFETGDLRARLAKHHADVDGAFWQWNDVWLSKAFASFDIRPECQRITAPLLLLQGLGDEYGTMLQLDEIALAAPHAQQIRLAECGHSPHRDQPQLCVQGIADFLSVVD
ncbi:MAG: alpha/beta hydrolase [Polaromonas sp.]